MGTFKNCELIGYADEASSKKLYLSFLQRLCRVKIKNPVGKRRKKSYRVTVKEVH